VNVIVILVDYRVRPDLFSNKVTISIEQII